MMTLTAGGAIVAGCGISGRRILGSSVRRSLVIGIGK
jgi:hypothetical protein